MGKFLTSLMRDQDLVFMSLHLPNVKLLNLVLDGLLDIPLYVLLLIRNCHKLAVKVSGEELIGLDGIGFCS